MMSRLTAAALLLIALVARPTIAMQAGIGGHGPNSQIAARDAARRKAAEEAARKRREEAKKNADAAKKAAADAAREEAAAEEAARIARKGADPKSGTPAILLPNVAPPIEEVSDLEIGIHVQLREIRDDLPRMRDRLRAVRCASETCYPVADVDALVHEIRARLREAIPDEAIELRTALNDALTIDFSLGFGTLQTMPLDGIHLVSLRAADTSTGFPASAVNRMLDRFEAILDRLLSHDLTPTVSIRSIPSGAYFETAIPGTQKKRGCKTDDQLPALWRSVYQTVVRKEGFREARYTFDLMNDARTTMLCTLVPTNTTGTSSCRVE
jgi:hypothetical protein